MKLKTKHIHITIIILGIIFISLCAFHTSMWFDESYSVAIAKHSFVDIWKITGNDVHPALYYWGLHIIYLIFGNSVIMFRLFSLIATIILGILGYTHIRKDFGERCGIIFSFLTYFLPTMSTHSQEIRMYSWSCLIVTITAIYAYRFYKNIKEKQEKGKTKNLIIFGIFSVCSCYIHYYALITTCLINLLLLIFLIKNRKEDKKSLINFLILAVVQIILYIPWLVYLIGQIRHVSNGFWIGLSPVSTPVETLSFQFRRELDSVFRFDIHTIISLVASILLYIYLGVKAYKYKIEKVDIKPAALSFKIYVGIIGIMLLISLIIMQAVFFSRYLFVITGLYIFGVAYMLSKESNKWIIFGISIVIIILGTISNITNIGLFYNKENIEVYNYIKDEIQENDILVYSNIGNGGVIAAYFPENTQYFLNLEYWDIDEAYKAYGPGMKTVYNWEFLENFTGRIWIIDSENLELYNNNLPKNNIEVIREPKRIDTTYHEYIYNVILVQKY